MAAPAEPHRFDRGGSAMARRWSGRDRFFGAGEGSGGLSECARGEQRGGKNGDRSCAGHRCVFLLYTYHSIISIRAHAKSSHGQSF